MMKKAMLVLAMAASCFGLQRIGNLKVADTLLDSTLGVSASALGKYHIKVQPTGRLTIDTANTIDTALWADTTPIAGHAVVSDLSDSCKGGAVRAAKLTTARTIGGVSFDGTANIVPDTCKRSGTCAVADSSKKVDSSRVSGFAHDVDSSKSGLQVIGALDVLTNTVNQLRLRNVSTAETGKYGYINAGSYTNTEEDISLINSNSQNAYCALGIGGGIATLNAATSINFFTAANPTTLSGTQVMWINNSQGVGIGAAPSVYKLRVVYGTVPFQFCVQNNITNSTGKLGQVSCGHYTNTEEAVTIMYASNQETYNSVYFGGGQDQSNAATTLYFITAANNTTLTGTQRMAIDAAGDITMASTTEATATNAASLELAGGLGVAKRIKAGDTISAPVVNASAVSISAKDSTGNLISTGYVRMSALGGGLQIKVGANSRMDTITLVSGTATISNTSVTAITNVIPSYFTVNGTPGTLYKSAVVAATSYTITSSAGVLDNSKIYCVLIEPSP